MRGVGRGAVPRRRQSRVRQKLASGPAPPRRPPRCVADDASGPEGPAMFGLIALGLEKALFTAATKMGEIDGAGFRVAKWYMRHHDRHGAEWREELRKEFSAQRRFVWDQCAAVELDKNVSFRALKYGL